MPGFYLGTNLDKYNMALTTYFSLIDCMSRCHKKIPVYKDINMATNKCTTAYICLHM